MSEEVWKKVKSEISLTELTSEVVTSNVIYNSY